MPHHTSTTCVCCVREAVWQRLCGPLERVRVFRGYGYRKVPGGGSFRKLSHDINTRYDWPFRALKSIAYGEDESNDVSFFWMSASQRYVSSTAYSAKNIMLFWVMHYFVHFPDASGQNPIKNEIYAL